MKKLFLHSTCATAVLLGVNTMAVANDTDAVVNRTGNLAIDTINKSGIFQWVEGSVGYAGKQANIDITTLSNLSETKDGLTYVQASYNRQQAVNRLNLGIGYRTLIQSYSAPLIIGVNAFIDSKDGTKKAWSFNASGAYQRYSMGLELKTATFDVSANMYRPLSKNIIKNHKVLKGWDITTKGTIPNISKLTLGVSMYNFDGVHDGTKNVKVSGNKLIIAYKPTQNVTLRGAYDKPNGQKANTNVSIHFKWAFGTSPDTYTANGTPAVWHKRFDKVERQYDIKIAKAKTIQTLGSSISRADIKSTDGTAITSGDGKSQSTAYGLVSGKRYNVNAFIGNPSEVTPTVKVEKISGLDTDFQFKDTSNNDITIANVAYDNTLVDQAGAGEAVLKLTYTADGYQTREIFVKTQAITSLAINSRDSLDKKPWGSAIALADYGLPTTVTVNGETLTPIYTFKVTDGSQVGGVTDDETLTNGIINANKTQDSGDIKVQITRTAIASKLTQATKTVTIPVDKKTVTPTIATDFKSHDDSHTPTGKGTSASPWQMANGKRYLIGEFVSINSALNSNTTVTVHWTNASQFINVGMRLTQPGVANINLADASFVTENTGFTLPTPLTRYIADKTGGRSDTVEFKFTVTNPDTDKYALTKTTVSAYLKTDDTK